MTAPLPPLATAGPSLDWYLTRSTGAVALLLLSVAVALGIADVQRLSSASWPRFLIDALHRNVSLLTLVFLALHILTAVLDSFASISPLAVLIPFVGSYRPLWLGLGAVAFDLLLAVILSSLMRKRIGARAWRATHWLVYACWPIALLHTLGTGSDVQTTWLLALSAACLALVLAAVLSRALAETGIRAAGVYHPASVGLSRESARRRGLAIGGALAFTLGLALWLPSGPLGSEWARRSGTPSALLHHPPASRSKIALSP
jgi:sulfoxide reductase heme-binding subunit YedZ